jgi:hypothetical protein
LKQAGTVLSVLLALLLIFLIPLGLVVGHLGASEGEDE